MTWRSLDKELRRVRPGAYVTAHLPWHARVHEILNSYEFATLFIVRDPRDVVASYVPYVLNHPNHFLHNRFSALPNDERRMHAVVLGVPAADTARGLPSLDQRIDAYTGWLGGADAVCRFEDLIGPEGGGDIGRQRRSIATVARACRRPLSEPQVQELASVLWSADSPTFRKGQIGSWREELSENVQRMIAETAGPQIERLGYEVY